MRLGWTTGKYSITYRAVKTIRVNGKNKTLIVKSFGSEKQICEKYGITDAKAWAKEQVRLMNEVEQEETGILSIELDPQKDLIHNNQISFNGGYLFIQSIYYELGLDKICRAIKGCHSFEYDLNAILSRLIYTRILFPSSKKSSFEDSLKFIEQPSFELHDVYRALSVLAEESDFIQQKLFKYSTKISKRNTSLIYYDCTNFYFEIEQSEDDKQYGVSKENRPLPIVEMGLFMDADGIPLAFCINPGNQNEQLSLIPLEKKLITKFDMSKFVVCTDAGLSSGANRYFNNYDKYDGKRSFITTQSIKKLKSHLIDWCLDEKGWYLPDNPKKTYNISKLDSEKDEEKIFYKSRWIKEPIEVEINGKKKKVELDQQLIVSYSLKYKKYQEKVREGQIARAIKAISKGGSTIKKKRQNDPKRFITEKHATADGEKADKTIYTLDENLILEESKFDGFYAVCTNLEDNIATIVKVNKRRWEIEECFRLMKSEFEARPVYLQRQERIVSHFITCFIALIIYRYLEKKLDDKYTTNEILDCLKEMNFTKYVGKGYQPTYTRTSLTDDLHDIFGFNTAKEIVPIKKMRNICSQTKKR